MLNLHGDQGSAKSTLCKLLSTLIDPSEVPCLTTRDGNEMVQGLAHRFCAVLDNVSTIPAW
jgi:ABC-type polysaccharide/polyol phosphate transport system ATPase subunit